MEKNQYKKIKKLFKIVEGTQFWQLPTIIFFIIIILLVYCLSILFLINKHDGSAVAIVIFLIILTVGVIFKIVQQISLRSVAKYIYENGTIVKAEVLDYDVMSIGHLIRTETKLLTEDGENITRMFPCGGIVMRQYEKYGVVMIQLKNPYRATQMIVLKAKEYGQSI